MLVLWYDFLYYFSYPLKHLKTFFFFRLFDVDGQGFIRGDTFRVGTTTHIPRLFFQPSSSLAYFKVPTHTLYQSLWYLGFFNISCISVQQILFTLLSYESCTIDHTLSIWLEMEFTSNFFLKTSVCTDYSRLSAR